MAREIRPFLGAVKTPRRILVALLATAGLALASPASAYVIRETEDGAPVRWPTRDVSYVKDTSLAAVQGIDAALATAAEAWSARARVNLTIAPEPADLVPGFDGKNGIFFGGWSFLPGQLAVTVVTYDEASGRVLDADVILRPDVDLQGTPGADEAKSYNLLRITSHELGHSLGLGDETDNTKAVMYLYTRPNDASKQTPTADDLAGIRVLYNMKQPDRTGGGGCSAAGARDYGGVALLGLVAALAVASRRRRVGLGIGVAGLTLALSNDVASAGERRDASLRVADATTEVRGGLFVTRVELEPADCARACPRVSAWVPGGRAHGLRQIVAHAPAPERGATFTATQVEALAPLYARPSPRR